MGSAYSSGMESGSPEHPEDVEGAERLLAVPVLFIELEAIRKPPDQLHSDADGHSSREVDSEP